MSKGYLSLVLHAHLPYVRHPEHRDFLEEDWLFEAITETYVPLLRMMSRLWHDGIDFRLTMSITPPLAEMLVDPLLRERYIARLSSLRELAHSQLAEREGTPFHDAAHHYVEELDETWRLYVEEWDGDILGQFRLFQDRGRLEIITCAATHGFLPLMATDTARRAQIEVAVANYEKHFGRRPRGIWLPECAFVPGLDRMLAEVGIRFFFVENHGLDHAQPRPRYGVHRPVFTPNGVAVFARDPETSRQVWSADAGYPGDPHYREFYRDLGYDLPYKQVRPYLHTDGVRRNIGLKFHRITGKVALDQKEPYVPDWARERAAEHAGDFLLNRQAQIDHLHGQLGVSPHLTAPYDAELYGHWWYEGPMFLEYFFRKAAADQDDLELVTPMEYLERETVHQEVMPSPSSWGAKGYFEVWLNESNSWIYTHLHRAEERMIELASRFPEADGTVRRALNQAARELVLAQASDWAFIMTMDTSVPYAEKQTRDHVSRFTRLYHELLEGRVDEGWLRHVEWMDAIFQEIDYRHWAPREGEGVQASAVHWTT